MKAGGSLQNTVSAYVRLKKSKTIQNLHTNFRDVSYYIRPQDMIPLKVMQHDSLTQTVWLWASVSL